jgi:tRNA threonylcarbamoyladenosine biosynthesis protein TsaB
MNAPCLLALDTATEVCSVALLRNGEVRMRSENVGQRHSEKALPLVDALLRESGISLKDLDYVAFGAGPGSFTGLRIACGLAQGLAWGAGKLVIPVGNLMALAALAFEREPGCERVLCAIDARMREAYCAIYQRGTNLIEEAGPRLARAEDLAGLAQEVDTIAGDALTVFPAELSGFTQRRLPGLRADAGDIARLAATPPMLARAVAPHAAAPLYVRDRVALTTEERRARTAAA